MSAGSQPAVDPLLIHVVGVDLDAFWVGVIGSLAVELVAVLAVYDADGQFPAKYRRVGFYVVRLLIAFTGGVLVEVYRVNNLPAALQIGASTPAVLAALATFRRPQSQGQAPPSDSPKH
jgi:hypothetical protein